MPSKSARYRLTIPDDRTSRQALRTWSLYRILVAIVFAGLFLTPLLADDLDLSETRATRLVTGALFIVAPILFLLATRFGRRLGLQTLLGATVDLTAVGTVLFAVGDINSGIGTLLVGSMILVGSIAPLRAALLYASAATITVLWQSVDHIIATQAAVSTITPAGTLGAAYFITALVGYYLASKARENQAIAQQRSEDLANLAELNERIIERMRTGIMIIDENNTAHLMNEAAWYLAGMPEYRADKLDNYSAALVRALERWRQDGSQTPDSVRLNPGVPSIVPRFAALASHQRGDVLVFLEDTSILSRRAHELTLASLGRLSASIAHEIRNPLGAISHSAQLLTESPDLSEPDHRLVSIVLRHCGRMNDIVENVLHLARQERTHPAPIELHAWLLGFVEEFIRFHDVGGGHLELKGTATNVWVLADVSQLQQVMWNLVQNAMKYGRHPGEAARVTIDWSEGLRPEAPWIEVCDEGPGVPPDDRDRIFEPFFTSSSDGSGLGLYLCQQLLEANQGRIRYEFDEGGSRFRIELTRGPAGSPEQQADDDRALPDNDAGVAQSVSAG